MMDPMTSTLDKPKCGARTRAGKPCKRPAGWATDHPGEGRCKLHGGAVGKHNAYSVTPHDERTKELVERLQLVVEEEFPGMVTPADLPLLTSAAVLMRKQERLTRWIQRQPEDAIDKTASAHELLIRVSRELRSTLEALGLSPAARARILGDKRGGFDLARALAELTLQDGSKGNE